MRDYLLVSIEYWVILIQGLRRGQMFIIVFGIELHENKAHMEGSYQCYACSF